MSTICCLCLSRERCECESPALVPLDEFMAKVDFEKLRLEKKHLEAVSSSSPEYCTSKIKRIEQLLDEAP